ncbi:hypothetical protein Pph01_78010 [Planotetraspora phitsanulokensis]|uniref:Uncharacterized protein n=1 Tax=Planotetraspora phitsanulokensis TaxID=575192 RepID=A0A8J3XNG4_9ACTN|nr:hypothetical protein Pph01_78010 [Planotetraspora phitsanulokensis]
MYGRVAHGSAVEASGFLGVGVGTVSDDGVGEGVGFVLGGAVADAVRAVAAGSDWVAAAGMTAPSVSPTAIAATLITVSAGRALVCRFMRDLSPLRVVRGTMPVDQRRWAVRCSDQRWQPRDVEVRRLLRVEGGQWNACDGEHRAG